MTDPQLYAAHALGSGSFKPTKNVLKHEKEAYEHSIPYTCHCYFQISHELQKTALTESWEVLLCDSSKSCNKTTHPRELTGYCGGSPADVPLLQTNGSKSSVE